MSTLIAVVMGTGALLLAVPICVLAMQSIAAFAVRPGEVMPNGRRPRSTVLVPAHDESSGLIPTVKGVLSQLRPGDRCVVIADNCSDDTARVAAAAGAEVIERTDAMRRGKGYALDYGLRSLDADPPEVVIVIDADCLVAEGCIDRIGRLCLATGRPVQALYLMKQPAGASRMACIAEFAWRVKNWARPLGWKRLGLPCSLMGTGMAFTWQSLQAVDLATGHIAEDMKLGVDLAKAGTPPLFCPEAAVESAFPSNQSGTRSQRTRWEHGHLALILGEVPALMARGIATLNPVLLGMALDLLVPPLALLVMMVGAWTSLCALLTFAFAIPPWPLFIGLSTMLLLLAAVVLAWWRFGRSIISIGALILAVAYALRKIPLYARFAFDRQAEWVRSRRDGQ
jgi:cellulose synthase/poly-beta-1,6-N-acetylglucosamine synthase-like glycosyltransferase